MDNVEFSTRLRNERARLQLTQEEFAKALGTSRGTIANCESGRSVLDTKLLHRADQVGLDIMYLVTGRKKYNALNWRLIQAIDICIGNIEAEHGKAPIQNRYLLQKLLYEKFSEQENVDAAEIEAYLRTTS